MFDSHCHLHDARMIADHDAALARARAAGVRGFLLAGVEPDGWQIESDIARRHSDVFVSYGLHPQLVAEQSRDDSKTMLDALSQELREQKLIRAVAIGEIGLDAYTPERRARMADQVSAFRAQLALAKQYDLPVILHILKAHDEALALLREVGLPKAGGVVHSYSGSAELLERYLTLGLHISLAGSFTWKNANKAIAAARAVPRDRLLVETDAPDQTPEPHRPGANEPAYLRDIIAHLATLRGESHEEVAQYTENNARRLFRLAEAS